MKHDELTFYYNKFKYGENVFHQLMKHSVQEVLLISSLYDSYVLEKDGLLTEQIYGDYQQLDLMMSPRITTVSFTDDIKDLLNKTKFDVVIIMMRIGTNSPYELSKEIRDIQPDTPILLLLNKQSYISLVEKSQEKMNYFDEIYIWKGDSKLFMAMIKAIEDKLNAEHDADIADIKTILLVESSIDYYSVFLPLFYTIGLDVTRQLINAEADIFNKQLKMKARPKILMVHSYDDAVKVYKKHKENLLCVVSNANLRVGEIYDERGGIKLLGDIRRGNKSIPLLLQSAELENAIEAEKIDAQFLHKFSSTMMKDLKDFILNNLGFGDFIFRDKAGKVIDKATTVYHLEKKLETISDESLLYHSRHNHFSAWLLAHSEIQLAKIMKSTLITDFVNVSDLRKYLISTIRKIRINENRGKVINFEHSVFKNNEKITQLSEGSMGGKGRGLAFLNALLVTIELNKEFKGVNVAIPKTAIIGTNEFDNFIENNQIDTNEIIQLEDASICEVFLKGKLSEELISKLKVLLQNTKKPLAVRSSGLLEDSQSQPFAGIYQTFMLPNIEDDVLVRLNQLTDAIKLVLASPLLKNARKYIESINFKIEEEKMAIIIQELVGYQDTEGFFYPHFSGVAQSYNFYPAKDMQHEDGIVSLAAGLGKAVVDGERTFRYCPKYPRVDLLEPVGMVENEQRDFYGIDLSKHRKHQVHKQEGYIEKKRIRTSHKEKIFRTITSVWDHERFRFLDAEYLRGPRILTFRNIIYYNKFPLSSILLRILDIGEIATGVPVEIEFAINLTDNNFNDSPAFYVLQIRPLSVNKEQIDIKLEKLKKDKILLSSTKAMGNGKIKNVKNIVYIDPEKFDNTKTLEMVSEIEKINNCLSEIDQEYVLIGPGRWGTSDRFLGLPVRWSQINKAKIIVEASQENFTVEASQGSHFFHNLVAMNVGYFTVSHMSKSDFVDWGWLNSLPSKHKYKYVNHIEFKNPLGIQIDGKKGIAIISKP